MADRKTKKWHHDAAARVYVRFNAAMIAAGIEIPESDKPKLIAAIACDIAEHEPPSEILATAE